MYATNHRWIRSFGIALILVLGISGIAQSRGVPPPAVPPGGAGIAAGAADAPAAQAAALAPQQQVTTPSGAVMFFDLDACPEGWSELPAARGRYVVGLVPGGQRAAAVGEALSAQENRPVGQHKHEVDDPGHGHTVNDPGHGHTMSREKINPRVWDAGHSITIKWSEDRGYGDWVDGTDKDDSQYTQMRFNTTADIRWDEGDGHLHTISSQTTGVSVNNQTTGITVMPTGTVPGTNAPYIQLLVCRKN